MKTGTIILLGLAGLFAFELLHQPTATSVQGGTAPGWMGGLQGIIGSASTLVSGLGALVHGSSSSSGDVPTDNFLNNGAADQTLGPLEPVG